MTMHTRAQKAALLVIAALVLGLAVTAVALEMRPEPARTEPSVDDHETGMAADERCVHMPEHCEGGASGGG